MPSLTMKWLFSQFRAKLVSSHRLSIFSKWVRHRQGHAAARQRFRWASKCVFFLNMKWVDVPSEWLDLGTATPFMRAAFSPDTQDSVSMMTGNLVCQPSKNADIEVGRRNFSYHHCEITIGTSCLRSSLHRITTVHQLDYRGWTSLVHPLRKYQCPLSPRFQLPPPKVEFESNHMKTPSSGGDWLQFTRSGYAMVLLGREPELEVEAWLEFTILFLTHPKLDELELAQSPDKVLVPNYSDIGLGYCVAWEEKPQVVTQLCSTAFTGAGAGTGDVCLSRSRALTISFNSATSETLPEPLSGLAPSREKGKASTIECGRTIGYSLSRRNNKLRPSVSLWEPGAIRHIRLSASVPL
ncbi:hypothetical protein Tco_1338790 [Tanacetum coccineum]